MERSEYSANLHLQSSHNGRLISTTRVRRVTKIEPLVRSQFWVFLIIALALKVLA